MMPRILLAQDDAHMRGKLERVLSARGYRVVSANNGKHAWLLARATHPHAIVADPILPELDGFDFCKRLKEYPSLRDVPFIFYSDSQTDRNHERFALSLGAACYIAKPAGVSTLLGALKALTETSTLHPLPRTQMSPTHRDRSQLFRLRSQLDVKIGRLERALWLSQEQSARFRDFAESGADWFWETDGELNLSWQSGGPPDLLHRPLLDLLRYSTNNAILNHQVDTVRTALQQRRPFREFVIEWPSPDERPQAISLSGTPNTAEDGEFHGYRGTGRDVTQTLLLIRRAEYLATHDNLTGLPNRSLLQERLDHAIARARRTHGRVGLFFIDLDNFKLVNDTLGHEVGDELIVSAAQRLKSAVRAADTLARLGGDEFVLVLDKPTVEEAHLTARRILETVSERFMLRNHEIHVTPSIGVSLFPDDADDAISLMKCADLAMYRVKEQGRNSYRFYTEDMNHTAQTRLILERSLRRALDRHELELYYQPQVDVETGMCTGIEALLRWHHPDWGVLSPDRFMPIAEQIGMLARIGDWVLATAVVQLAAWRDQGVAVPRIAVNFCPSQLFKETLAEEIPLLLLEHGLQPAQFCMEITEQTLADRSAVIPGVIAKLRQAGVHIAVDDFGVGYGSLTTLKRFPVDELKIDRVFVEALTNSPEETLVTRAIIALAQSLKLRVTAKGVETAEQVAILREQGCTFAQGHFYASPMTAAELSIWLQNRRQPEVTPS